MKKWAIENLISVGETVIYKTQIEDEESEERVDVYLTNQRIMWIRGNFVDCRLLKFISKCGMFIGFDAYHEVDDIGTGEYGIYFGDFDSYESIWFYSETVWKAFYEEFSRTLLEEF